MPCCEGKKQSNHGEVLQMITSVVNRIREAYREDIPILITGNSGFYVGDLFAHLKQLEVGYVIGGRLEEEIDDFTDGSFPV